MFIRFFQTFFFLFSLSPFSLAQGSCRDVFKGLREAQEVSASQAETFDKNLPRFVDIIEESRLAEFWSSKTQGPNTLSAFLPKDVSFISHRLRESQEAHLVKFPAFGSAMIVRAKYESQGQNLETNISFNKEGLIDNLDLEQKWLVGPRSKAAVLFLHGGGTKSSGGHVAEAIINHFQKHNVSVISPDLPWHAEGPRTFMGTLDQEMLALADLAKKYIHPDVPLFIWGHSWGGTFAHRIMQMSGEREKGFFQSLKALIITSPAVDPAPGKSLKEKKRAFFTRLEEGLKKEDERAPNEGHIFHQMVLDGKTSPTGQFFSSLTLSELNDQIPEHQGRNYLPSLMIVGVGDSMVYLGFEDLFHNYYDQLENVEAHYLEKLPLLVSDRQNLEKVGHLLSDYLGPKGKNPVNFELAMDFINKHIDIEKSPLNKNKEALLFDMLNVVQLWANDLSFREWAKTGSIIQIKKTDYFKEVKQEYQNRHEMLLDEMIQYSPSVYLLKLFEKMTEDNLFEVQEKLKPLQNFFSSYSDFYVFLKAKNFGDIELTLKKLSERVTQGIGKKYKQNFLKDIFDLAGQDSNYKKLHEKYFYLSNKDIEEINKLFQGQYKLEQKMKEIYIPAVEDYKEHGHLIDKEIYQKIKKIEDNIQKRLQLEDQSIKLGKEIVLLVRQFNTDIDRVRHFIKELKLILEEAFSSPPDFLKAELENSEKEFLDLYEFSEKMGLELEEESLRALGDRDFSLQSIHNHLAPHRSMIDEFNKKYDTFIQNRKKLQQAVIKAIKAGEFLSEEKDYLRQELYEETGLYSQLNEISLLLSQKEAEKQKQLNQKIELIEEYNQLIPYPAISESYHWFAQELLNLSGFNKELLEKNRLQLQHILKNWNNLHSQVLPPLPN